MLHRSAQQSLRTGLAQLEAGAFESALDSVNKAIAFLGTAPLPLHSFSHSHTLSMCHFLLVCSTFRVTCRSGAAGSADETTRDEDPVRVQDRSRPPAGAPPVSHFLILLLPLVLLLPSLSLFSLFSLCTTPASMNILRDAGVQEVKKTSPPPLPLLTFLATLPLRPEHRIVNARRLIRENMAVGNYEISARFLKAPAPAPQIS